MSYHDGRSSILGGSPEPGLSSVIKVNRRSSYKFRQNEERLIFLFSSGTCPTRSLVRCSDPNCSVNCCYDRYHSVNLIKIFDSFGFLSTEIRGPAFERRSRSEKPNCSHKDSRHCHKINFPCRFQDGFPGIW